MKIVFINSCNFGSTGSIVNSLSTEAIKRGYETTKYIPNTSQNMNNLSIGDKMFGNKFFRNVSSFVCECLGLNDHFNYFATYKLINSIKKIKPDIVHLHNLHGNYINMSLLLKFLSKSNFQVIWTFHDCWPITGRCPHFLLLKCYKWTSGCFKCSYAKNEYPKAKIDRTKFLWHRKRKLLDKFNNLHIVTPSNWLNNLISFSFLKDKKRTVINNGIDLNVFKPTISNFKTENHCKNKFVILGVSFDWGFKKGLDVFVNLASKISDDYIIVLVGTNSKIDDILPKNIISIHKTNSKKILAEIYSSANVFLNPTREDNFPTVNIESLACGTPVITFDTGGSPEIIDNDTGIVLHSEDIDLIYSNIRNICENNKISREKCLLRAEQFNAISKYNDYIDLYESCIKIN